MNGRYGEPRPIVFGGPLSNGVRTLLFATVGVWIFQFVAQHLHALSCFVTSARERDRHERDCVGRSAQ